MNSNLEKNNTAPITKINTLLTMAIAEGLPVAMWRKPNDNYKNVAISLHGETVLENIDFDELTKGFLVSPFIGDAVFIKADLSYCFDSENEDAEIEDDIQGNNTIKETFEQKAQAYFSTFSKQLKMRKKGEAVEQERFIYNESIFTKMVENAIQAIKTGRMQKVVLSRTTAQVLPEDFDLVDTFNKLCKAYHSAFVGLVFLPSQNAIWLCASPEKLVSFDKNGIFSTMALAGTQSAIGTNGQKLSPNQARWSQKEIEEQAYVSRYIIECFKKIRLREYIESGPKTIIAGNLMHLRTDYSVDTNQLNIPELTTIMLQLLHPTSAVCGTPKEQALAFIQNNEAHHRELYSGFLGPVNVDNETHIFVNLRTMKIEQNHATFYAGCGITEESDPQSEWLETEMKCQTLMNVCSA